MASIQKMGDKWRVQVKVKEARDSASFSTEEDAIAWGRMTEERLKRGIEVKQLLEVGVKPAHFPTRIFQAMMDAPANASQIIAASVEKSAFCGIYFLIKDGQIVYVGQSINAMRRLTRHIDEGKDFDRFAVVSCPKDDMDKMERTFIAALAPKENMTFGNV